VRVLGARAMSWGIRGVKGRRWRGAGVALKRPVVCLLSFSCRLARFASRADFETFKKTRPELLMHSFSV